jgi:hypothetical protein
MQSVPITTNVESSNPVQAGLLDTTLCDKVCQWLAAGQWFSPRTPVPSFAGVFVCLFVFSINKDKKKQKTDLRQHCWPIKRPCFIELNQSSKEESCLFPLVTSVACRFVRFCWSTHLLSAIWLCCHAIAVPAPTRTRNHLLHIILVWRPGCSW